MKTLLFALLLLPSVAMAADGYSLSITSIVTNNVQRRSVSVELRTPNGITLGKDAYLAAIVGIGTAGPADAFGPPQNFALTGTSHQIGPGYYRVSIALPIEKITVRFILRDNLKVLLEENREI